MRTNREPSWPVAIGCWIVVVALMALAAWLAVNVHSLVR